MAATKEDGNRVREWETGLPSAADLTPLSHSLISRVLARAFCIPPPAAPPPTSSDVLLASQSTLLSLLRKPPEFPFNDPYSAYEPGSGAGFGGMEEGVDEDRGGGYELLKRKKDGGRRESRVAKSLAMNKVGLEEDKGLERDGGGSANGMGGNGNSGPDYAPFYWAQRAMPGSYPPLGPDQGGYGGLEAGSENSKGANLDSSRKMADAESEDVDSADGPDGNTARTLKRPRLVWTPQLHKRFVDAVGHLGIKNAVPKTIMQLMNVEGLTRENVASHLQKYRLYLKRMQGLSTEGPSASDPLFASSPIPPNLSSFPQAFPSHHHSRVDNGVVCPPISPPQISIQRAHGAMGPGPMGPGALGPGPVGAAHFGSFEHHPYNMGFARTVSQQPPNVGDHREFMINPRTGQPSSGSPPQRILTLFPPSGH